MRFLRILGWIFLILALIIFANDFLSYVTEGSWKPTILGRLWSEWSPQTLQLIQPAIERHLWEPLWSDFLFPILLQPASLVFGILGLIFWFIGRSSRPHRVHRR